MIIPREYGGLGFSGYAHSQVVQKISTRSGTVAVTVLVPNSLGPGELLLHYGTDEQKRHYLPRLARASKSLLRAHQPERRLRCGVDPGLRRRVLGRARGQEGPGAQGDLDKRYITLGPVATLSGSRSAPTIRITSPANKDEIGITCALIPTSHPGVDIGRRHMPLNAVFQNGPTGARTCSSRWTG